MRNAILILDNDFEVHLRVVISDIEEVLGGAYCHVNEGFNVYTFGDFEISDLDPSHPFMLELEAHAHDFLSTPNDMKYMLVEYEKDLRVNGNRLKYDLDFKLEVKHKDKIICEDH